MRQISTEMRAHLSFALGIACHRYLVKQRPLSLLSRSQEQNPHCRGEQDVLRSMCRPLFTCKLNWPGIAG